MPRAANSRGVIAVVVLLRLYGLDAKGRELGYEQSSRTTVLLTPWATFTLYTVPQAL